MTQTITTALRLADDSATPITIQRRGPCSQWSAVTIADKPPYICKRGHVVTGRNALLHIVTGKAYVRCRTCSNYNKRISRQRGNGAR
jgi:hypothetical protein